MNNNFKIGDKVVCINNTDNYSYLYQELLDYLELGKVYTILYVRGSDYQDVEVNNDTIWFYSKKRFMLLSEYRKIKINKILNDK